MIRCPMPCVSFSAVLAMASLAVTGARGASAPGKWISRSPLPIARGETGAARIDNRIYLAGGFDGGLSPTKEMQVYTPTSNAWQASTPMPTALHHLGMASVGGKLYVMGGVVNGLGGPHPNGAEWTGSTTALQFDPATSQWKSIKALPHSTAASGVAAWGGKIYVIGGIDIDGIALDLVQEYDPATDTWASKAAMPTKREHVGVVVLDSLIYVVSGRVGSTSFKTFEAFSPASNKWYTLPDMPTARSDIGFSLCKGRMFAMGGEKPGIFDVNEEYDPDAKSWSTAVKMTSVRKAFSAVGYGDTVFVLGGFAANGLTTMVEAYLPPGGSSTRLVGKKTEGFFSQLGGQASLFRPAYDAMGRAGILRDRIGSRGGSPAASRIGYKEEDEEAWFGIRFTR
jgi:hypothetical protein